jgi:TPR repeat protein
MNEIKELLATANQGDVNAQHDAGISYYYGYGVSQDYNEAIKWYSKAAEQGHAESQYYLGMIYDNGYGVPQDYAQAHMWFNLSAAQGHNKGREGRDLIADKMPPTQIAEAQKLAREWLVKK